MNQSKYIWMNGEMIPWENATVHVMAHALHYGSSVFEGIRCYDTPSGRCIFRLGSHIRRFFDSAKLYRYPISFSQAEIEKGCCDSIVENDLKAAYIRPLAFLGAGSLGVVPSEDVPTNVIIAAMEFGAYLGEEGLKSGIDVCVSSWARTTSAALPILSKAGGHYLNAQLIGGEARRNGFAEGISVTSRGTVSEGSAENIFVIRDGKIFTPPLSAAILNGITRDSAFVLARDLGYEVIEQEIPRELLYVADEVFLTGTAAEITPVRSVDRIEVGNGSRGPITEVIQSAFFGLFDGTTEDKWGWLDSVERQSS
ncbi:MAG: branched-chain amino acid aminotransferase [Mariniblastus sp.]|jgi:branched-chain amino acid aminotransferase